VDDLKVETPQQIIQNAIVKEMVLLFVLLPCKRASQSKLGDLTGEEEAKDNKKKKRVVCRPDIFVGDDFIICTEQGRMDQTNE